MKVLRCRLCKIRGIKISYFRKVKDGQGLPPNCICQSGSGDIGGYWQQVDFVFEDDLPMIDHTEYGNWYSESMIVDGVRMGPKIGSSKSVSSDK